MMATLLVPLLLTGALLCTGCSRAPEGYSPPLQRQFGAAPAKPSMIMAEMADPAALAFIVNDIQDGIEGSGWRWTHQRPELRYELDRTDGWKLACEFSFPKPNFRDTGPVTVSFFVNGRALGQVRYTEPGDKRFEKPVPAAWLRTGEYTTVRAEVDPPWIAPTDKVRLGMVLFRAGFIR
jgi:hypothetical protein